AQVRKLLIKLQPHLLKYVGNIFSRGANEVRDRIDEALVPRHQFLPCFLIALGAALDQLTIACLYSLHCWLWTAPSITIGTRTGKDSNGCREDLAPARPYSRPCLMRSCSLTLANS